MSLIEIFGCFFFRSTFIMELWFWSKKFDILGWLSFLFQVKGFLLMSVEFLLSFKLSTMEGRLTILLLERISFSWMLSATGEFYSSSSSKFLFRLLQWEL